MGALGTKTDSAQLPFSTLPKATGAPRTPLAETRAGSREESSCPLYLEEGLMEQDGERQGRGRMPVRHVCS